MGVYDSSGTRPRTGKRKAVTGKGKAQPPSTKRTVILATIAFVLIAVAVGISVIPRMFAPPPVVIPDEVIGVWETRAERYADRTFEISPSTVLFRTGTGESDFTFHEIAAVERKRGRDGMEYVFTYADDREFSFIFSGTAGTIQFMNQREFFWTRRGATPTTIASLPATAAIAAGVSGESDPAGQEEEATQPVVDLPQTETAVDMQAAGQEELIREVFSYRGTGRDPFRSLLQSNDVRPLQQDLRIASVTYAVGNPAGSVAVLRDTVANKAYPVRVGDELGRLRVIEILPGQVVLVMAEFGTERRVVLNQRLDGIKGRSR